MTTYYIRADGTAANKGAASGPGSTQSACMNIAVHNGETFSAGDIIKLCDDGGIFRGAIVPPSAGSVGSPIVYEPEAGDSPQVYGSAKQSTWSDEGSNNWSCSQASDPLEVFFVNTNGTIKWGNEQVSQMAMTEEYDWFWDDPANKLFCFAASDPDSRYASVEATVTAAQLFQVTM